MRKIGLACALIGVLAIPATAAAGPENRADVRNAARECKAERQAVGAETFAETHRTFGQCVRRKARENAAERRSARRQAVRSAARQCRAEREELGEEAFRDRYGTNRNKRNAFGKCVESKVSQDDAPEGEQQPETDSQPEGQGGRPDGVGGPDDTAPPQDA